MRRRLASMLVSPSRQQRHYSTAAGYGQVTSVSAVSAGLTRDGLLAHVEVVVTYQFLGGAAGEGVACETSADFFASLGLDPVVTARDRFGPPSDHTWWPQHTPTCVASSLLCRGIGTLVLAEMDSGDLAGPTTSACVADAVYARALDVMPTWGARPVTAMASTWRSPPCPYSVLWSRTPAMASAWSLPRENDPVLWSRGPAMASARAPWIIDGLPDPGDPTALWVFERLAEYRDVALEKAVGQGFDPYSYEGVRAMSRTLRWLERMSLHNDALHMVSGIASMRRQLYASPHRH